MSRHLIVGFACLMSVTVWAQQPTRTAAAKPTGNQAQQPAGSVRNDRLATMPHIGVSANSETQNQLVGCVAQNGHQYVLSQELLGRTYQLRGQDAAVRDNVGKMVQVTGRLIMGRPAAFDVQQVQVVQPKCDYAESSIVKPVTGGTGAQGTAFVVSSTSSLGQPTPGVETEPGVKQNPKMAEGVSNFGAYPVTPAQRTASDGAPPNPRIENPMEAERIANAAARNELNNTRQLGVNAQPNYAAETTAQQTQQLAASEAQQMRGQAGQSGQVLSSGAAGQTDNNGTPQQEASPGTSPVFAGCVTEHDNKAILVETATSEQFRLDAGNTDLGQYMNRQVRVVGTVTGTYGPAVGTAGSSATVHVQSIQSVGNCNSR
jgi:hypothetical protein